MHSREKPNFIQDLDPEEGKHLLQQGAASMGVNLSSRQLEQFLSYLSLLIKWNRHMNLTGLRSCREIMMKHFLDSLTPLPYLPKEARILDLGSGAGFPGLPIKIARSAQSVTLIESSAKKVSFLKEAVRYLEVGSVPIFQTFLGKGSSPLSGINPFDIIISRAVGNLVGLLSAAGPYLPFGGKIMLMKGRQGAEEIFKSRSQIQEKGFRIEAPVVLFLPFLGQERQLIFLSKEEEGMG